MLITSFQSPYFLCVIEVLAILLGLLCTLTQELIQLLVLKTYE